MRVAITLDDDLSAMLHEEMERSGETFKQVVNRLMRVGFGVSQSPVGKPLKAKPLSRRRPEKTILGKN
jgi:hypothetical protein